MHVEASLNVRKHRTLLIGIVLCACFPVSAHARRYFVDSKRGNDTASGRSPRTSWRTLSRAVRDRIKPGDELLLRAGAVWREPLKLRWSGTQRHPIKIGSYGVGALPRLEAGDRSENAVELVNVSHIRLHHLELTNRGTGIAVRRAVLIGAENHGVVRDVEVTDLYIHDVNGTDEQKDNGGIVFRTYGQLVPSRFENLRIERNIMWKVDRSAIVGESDEISRKLWNPSRAVVIRDNYAEDIGGDGIVPWATDRALVEHNIVRHAVNRSRYYNARIWQWSTDDTLIQLNEVAFTHGKLDGQGFDSDYNSRGTTFLYNYSHDNDGGFLLICGAVKPNSQENVGNVGTLVRHNISVDDHTRSFHISGTENVVIEGNLVRVAPNDDVQLVLITEWDGWPNGVYFSNNRFDSAGIARYGHEIEHIGGEYRIAPGWGPARDVRFDGNRYSGTHFNPPADAAKRPGITVNWGKPAVPTFDPSSPIGFRRFMKQHRRAMIRLMAHEFGTFQLASPQISAAVTQGGKR